MDVSMNSRTMWMDVHSSYDRIVAGSNLDVTKPTGNEINRRPKDGSELWGRENWIYEKI